MRFPLNHPFQQDLKIINHLFWSSPTESPVFFLPTHRYTKIEVLKEPWNHLSTVNTAPAAQRLVLHNSWEQSRPPKIFPRRYEQIGAFKLGAIGIAWSATIEATALSKISSATRKTETPPTLSIPYLSHYNVGLLGRTNIIPIYIYMYIVINYYH